MTKDRIQTLIEQLEPSVQPRPEFSERLLRDLIEVLESDTQTPPERSPAKSRPRPNRRRVPAWLAAAAALLLFGNLAVVYFAPTYGLALAGTPGLGDAVQPVLEFSGLNPDQLTPANETASSAGHTIRVTGGFADPTRTVVLIEVDGQHPLPNKHQTCCEVEARLTDQFGVSYAQRHNLDVLTLAFEPLTGPELAAWER